MKSKPCDICNEAGEMEFNILGQRGMLTAVICLACFGLAGSDHEIAYIIARKRKECLAEVFPWIVDLKISWDAFKTQYSAQKAEQVNLFLLTGEQPRVD